MNYFKLIFVIFILFTFSTNANDVQIIELHKNKSLDQLVLEKENNDNDHFKDMSIEFLTPDRLIARVSGQNTFSQLSCVQLKLDQE